MSEPRPSSPRLLGLGAALLVGTALVTACDPPQEASDLEQYWLSVDLVHRSGDSRQVLVGSRFNASVVGVIPEGTEPAPELQEGSLECVLASASGTLDQTGGSSYEVLAAGPGAIELAAPEPGCTSEPAVAGRVADRWVIDGVAAENASGAWYTGTDLHQVRHLVSLGPVGESPGGGALGLYGAPLVDFRVAEGGQFELLPTLLDPGGAEIRWREGDGELEVPAAYAELATMEGDDGEPEPRRGLAGVLGAGDVVDGTLKILGVDVPLPPVVAVPASEIASVNVLPVYAALRPSERAEREWGPPAGVVAIARDAEGRRIVGAPVTWTVTRGRILVAPWTESDAIASGDCRDAPRQAEPREAEIEASIGDVVGRATLEWTALASDQTQPDDGDCTGSACDCSATARPRDSALAFGFLLVAGWRRRRRPATS